MLIIGKQPGAFNKGIQRLYSLIKFFTLSEPLPQNLFNTVLAQIQPQPAAIAKNGAITSSVVNSQEFLKFQIILFCPATASIASFC
ncbi:hypothetical protein U0X60_000215 [Salmonella enterica]|uniref:hypothetical protein n=1 Tax=Enterobacteriaceae TaxID=543 RepID=UPI001912E8FF|nr:MULTISPECIES: hypothetical protein [Enterobacteriaceae]ELZ7781368.1 hypothetical protein [Salmonella enterica]MDZ5683460.1 hypothetical protein [Enterobacter hormaechei]WLP10069.1 hypothetical protein Q8Z25_19605 [Enterobacter hormaechei]HCD9775523.1 hypothetical protein [Enterobacter hormaechei]HCE3975434.1 hypothetical protein [Enterobacter hormaechei]